MQQSIRFSIEIEETDVPLEHPPFKVTVELKYELLLISESLAHYRHIPSIAARVQEGVIWAVKQYEQDAEKVLKQLERRKQKSARRALTAKKKKDIDIGGKDAGREIAKEFAAEGNN